MANQHYKSRSAWSAWIESFGRYKYRSAEDVALRMERVDRKIFPWRYLQYYRSRAPHGARGSKATIAETINKVGGRAPHGARGSKEWRNGKGELNEHTSRSAWSAWIESTYRPGEGKYQASRAPHGARGSKGLSLMLLRNLYSRAPHGARGSKAGTTQR